MMAFLYELLHMAAAAVLAIAGIGYDRAEPAEDKPLPRAIEAAFTVTGDHAEFSPAAFLHGHGGKVTVTTGGAEVCVEIPEPPAAPAAPAI